MEFGFGEVRAGAGDGDAVVGGSLPMMPEGTTPLFKPQRAGAMETLRGANPCDTEFRRTMSMPCWEKGKARSLLDWVFVAGATGIFVVFDTARPGMLFHWDRFFDRGYTAFCGGTGAN